jgi:DNA-binding transcriptional regulator YiaG
VGIAKSSFIQRACKRVFFGSKETLISVLDPPHPTSYNQTHNFPLYPKEESNRANMPENEYVPTDIITRIKAVRLHLHLSQQQFADLTNVPVTLFKQWENGSIRPPNSYWQRILLIETSKSQTTSHNGTIHEPNAPYSTYTDKEETFPTDFLADPDVVRTFVYVI